MRTNSFFNLPAAVIFMATLFPVASTAQDSDDRYETPLSGVLDTIASIYGVSISYTPQQVEGKTVDYAPWRIHGDVHTALKGVLDLFGMGYYNSYGTDRFRIGDFEYYRWSVDEGKRFLDRLESETTSLPEWEYRREELKAHLPVALRIEGLPEKIYSGPILSKTHERDGYSFRNISLEVLPGFYVSGTIYFPANIAGKAPVVLCPTGHWEGGRYREDHQLLCATLARMGAIAASYDLFAWGEGTLQFREEDHRRSLSMTFQTLSSLRYLDYLLALPDADPGRVAVTGGSGAGSHTVLLAAMDDRIKVSVPVVSLSCHFFGGCPCESGMPIHVRDGRMFTNNVELAAVAAPRPMAVVSDGRDWTFKVPEIEYPYLQRIYALYQAVDNVSNAHFPEEGHDFGPTKREAVYGFLTSHLRLDPGAVTDRNGLPDESRCSIEPVENLLSFGPGGDGLPADAVKSYESLVDVFEALRRDYRP